MTRYAPILLLFAGCATQDLPLLPDGFDQPTMHRLVEAKPFMGPVQQQPGPSIAWQGEPGHTYFIEEMNRAQPNEWTRVATNLTVDAESNGLWQTWYEGNWRVGVER